MLMRPQSIRVDDGFEFRVSFSPLDREAGYEDDIRFEMVERQPEQLRMLSASAVSILLTAEQAEKLADALRAAADASRATPW